MKSVSVLILVLLIIFGTLKEASIYVIFKLNQKYIAKNLCVEKDIEESTCKGCCQLKEKLSETSKTEQENFPERQRETINPLHFVTCQKSASLDKYLKYKQIELSCLVYLNNYSFIFLSDCFHPPRSC